MKAIVMIWFWPFGLNDSKHVSTTKSPKIALLTLNFYTAWRPVITNYPIVCTPSHIYIWFHHHHHQCAVINWYMFSHLCFIAFVRQLSGSICWSSPFSHYWHNVRSHILYWFQLSIDSIICININVDHNQVRNPSDWPISRWQLFNSYTIQFYMAMYNLILHFNINCLHLPTFNW